MWRRVAKFGIGLAMSGRGRGRTTLFMLSWVGLGSGEAQLSELVALKVELGILRRWGPRS
jgi:hypothetical protein